MNIATATAAGALKGLFHGVVASVAKALQPAMPELVIVTTMRFHVVDHGRGSNAALLAAELTQGIVRQL